MSELDPLWQNFLNLHTFSYRYIDGTLSYLSILIYVLDAQKNRLIETVLLSTHNICFGLEFRYPLLTKVLFNSVYIYL